jgi:aerobic-type carbon monoxide dehydrogenase small subunit (CoxS/CutS family)
MAMSTITLRVNGQERTVTTPGERPLLEVLREDLQLTGTKFGCGEGQCGACSVLVDGKRVFSCRTSVSKVEGKAVQTIAGLAGGDQLHPVQQAFLAENAFQCGYCTPGMIMATVALLAETAKPSDEQIRAGMNRNLCRCCVYTKVLQAVRRAAEGTGR